MEVDKSNLKEVILDSVNQLEVELEFFNQLNINRRSFSKVILCGMGGSNLIGDMLAFFKINNFSPLTVTLPLLSHRSYGLPAEADRDTLVICVSYSGNTEESLSAYQVAKQAGLEIAGIASGGKLTELLQKEKHPWIKIARDDIPPRFSLGYQLAALTKLLMSYGLLPPFALQELAAIPDKIKPAQIENEAKLLCHKLNHRIPIIYCSDQNHAIAHIWKIKFNENAKIPAFWNVFPELNHNEMNGWSRPLGPFHFLFLRDPDDLPRIQKRADLTAEILKQNSLPVDFVKMPTFSNPAEKLFWMLAFGDWLSYHLALFYGIDPAPVDMVEEFKKRLNE